jgi:Protein of unknown function (DUF559)/Transcriptional regulator, AbiEi antitoxin/AbiEi antitoxin C-terminal domain
MATERNRTTRSTLDGRLSDVATGQRGIAGVHQLADIGISPRSASRRAQGNSLHRVHRGVYAVGHRAIGRVGVLQAALLACGEGAVLSHGTAAALWGIWDKWPSLVDVTVPVQRGRKIDGIRCRRCRYPAEEEVTVRSGLASTTPARVLVDLAGILSFVALRRAVEQAAVLKLLDVVAVDLAIENGKHRRGVRRLRAILVDWRAPGPVPDLRSALEAMLLPRLVAAGLPRPECNASIWLDGEQLLVDFFWPEQRLVVETDGGAVHGTPAAFQRDRRRDQLLLANGLRVLRITWVQLRDEPAEVIGRIVRALTT